MNTFRAISLSFVLLLTGVLTVYAGQGRPASGQFPAEPPNELVRQVVENEVKHGEDTTHYMYKDERKTPSGSWVKEIVETPHGSIAKFLQINGAPPSPQRQAEDEAKLDKLVKDPELMKKKAKSQKDDADRATRMFKELPNAFIFQYESVGTASNGDELVKLTFKPNPKYDPPSREMAVYAAMQGHLVVNAARKRMTELDAKMFRDVNFGWGILGHLDKGGHFNLVQSQIGPDRWEIVNLDIQFTGKALMFKTINMHQVERFYDWHKLPENLTIAQAVQLLNKHEPVVAENGGSRK